MKKIALFFVVYLLLLNVISLSVKAQTRVLSLQQTIELANDSSLEAFRSKNLYMSGYWEYRTYRANRLPSLTLNMTPAEYYRDIARQYNYQENVYDYRRQEYFYANANLAIQQNFDLLGGTFFIDSDLGYIQNFGDEHYSQFTTIPVRLGYNQKLIGYNPFRWDRKIEPLKYEKVKKELLYNIEQTSEQATTYFFELAMAQAEYDLAKKNVASSDTLYKAGMERYKIAAISQADLLTLKLDKVNALNTLKNTEISLKRAMFSLASYLNFDKNADLLLLLPVRPPKLDISVDVALSAAKENNPQFLELKQNILEAERDMDKSRKESIFDVNLTASVGFNQVANNLRNAYRNPLQQDVVALSLSIPLVDWGVRKGKYNMAKNNLNVIRITSQQKTLSLEEDVIMTVRDFNIQQELIGSAEEALDLANLAYNEMKQRFMIGKADINSLTLSLNRQQEAQRNYILALQNFWLSYYKIRKLTLHDFEVGIPLSDLFDYKLGM
ncbi:MAG: TolC family protein [Bacteroidales bacterium]|nr:TolC family protein [Bacteroidales bacterium]